MARDDREPRRRPGEIAQHTREKAAELAQQTRERASELAQQTKERATELAKQTRDKASEIASEVASQPPPRRAEGLAAPALRMAFAWPFRVALAGLLRLGVTPNQLTILSLLAYLTVAGMLAAGWRFLPGILMVPAALFDIFDGAVARGRGEVSRRGAWLDSVIDRASDAAVLAALFMSLAAQGSERDAGLALGALVVSLLVSFARAQASALGVEMGEGIFARAERNVALMVGLTQPGALPWALGALVVLGVFALVQRVALARAPLRRADLAEGAPRRVGFLSRTLRRAE